MKNVSNCYDKVHIWNDGVGGWAGERLGSIDDVTTPVGWWDEQNGVSY